MSSKNLCVFALLAAPFLCIGFYVEEYYPPAANSRWTGAWGLIYMTGWMASMVILQRHRLTGNNRYSRNITWLVVYTLILANISNLWQLMAPTYKPFIFWIFDFGWPLGNILMLIVGVAVLRANRLRGWKRWVPLGVGLWLPFSFAVQDTPLGLHLSSIYSLVGWSLLALVLYRETTLQKHTDNYTNA